jgi:integrase/recombinase XerD
MASTSLNPDPAELYLSQLGTEHSQATARSALRTIACALDVDTIDWTSLTYADFARVRAELGRLSVPWGNACLSVLRRCAVESRKIGVLDAALVDDVLSLPRLRGTSGRLGRDIDDTEIDALFDACDPDTVVGRRDRALLALLVYGGLRRSECAAVDAADVVLVNRVVTVRAGKGRKTRQIPIPRVAADILGDWLEVHPGHGGQLLRSVDRWGNCGGRFSSDSVAFVLERLCDRAGVERASAHAFRARRITEIIAHPHSDVFLAAKMAGHCSIAVTARYDRRGLDALTGVIDELQLMKVPPVDTGRRAATPSIENSELLASRHRIADLEKELADISHSRSYCRSGIHVE